MCGIFAFIGNPGVSLDINEFRRALGLLTHRGPDHQGEWFNKNIYLGHQRLAIVDLDANANQPMWDRNNENVIIFNGEIYNYQELKIILQKQGFQFNTRSDTEVLLHALRYWKDDVCRYLEGMYSIIYYNKKDNYVRVIRDPMGQKPIYYARYLGGYVFASELRSLLELKKWQLKLNKPSFYRYLARGYYGEEETPICGIKKLLPGTIIDVKNGSISEDQYWRSIPDQIKNGEGYPITESVDEFDNLFNSVCERHMRCDVDYGVFLSGGIDSTLVLDACKISNSAITAFSVGMEEEDFDESAKAELVAEHLKIANFHKYLLSNDNIVEMTWEVSSKIDEPHGDPGMITSYFLSKMCSKRIKVGIAGDGGDELFGGYETFKALPIDLIARKLPQPSLTILRRLVNLAPDSDKYMNMKMKLDAFLRGYPNSDINRINKWLTCLDEKEFLDLLGIKVPSLFSSFDKRFSEMENNKFINKLLYYYQKCFLPEFVCAHTDRAAMLNSLEVRSPFLAPSMVEFANHLPDNAKIFEGQLKHILVQSLQRRGYPDSILFQRKRGFTFPVARWLKSTLRPFLESSLKNNETIDKLFPHGHVNRLVDEHVKGVRNHYRVLYSLIMFIAWHKNYPQVEI